MVSVRLCNRNDVQTVVSLLADDVLGTTREDASEGARARYLEAFDAMDRQEGNDILLAVDDDTILGCLQFTIIRGLSRLGMARAQVEGVRVAKDARGRGIGELLMQDAIERARAAGCGLVQLTTDKQRGDAHRFYERLGFVASHEGMKLVLD